MQATPITSSRRDTVAAHRRNPLARFVRPNGGERRGAVAVEMAIVMTFIFVPMLLGIIEFGRMMMVGQVVTTASRYGVRHAILDGTTNSEVETMIVEYLVDSLGVEADEIDVDIDITPDGSNPIPSDVEDAQRRDLVEVEVAVPWNDVALIKGDYLNDKMIRSKAAMRHE